ncbi:hypothetical protein [Actinomadura sp. NTSP31]|uniref:hypothetical protein n=1 Tax=Actinomadura sp. NTSP31 TaxID=1735447 RepID=UPI0035C137F5
MKTETPAKTPSPATDEEENLEDAGLEIPAAADDAGLTEAEEGGKNEKADQSDTKSRSAASGKGQGADESGTKDSEKEEGRTAETSTEEAEPPLRKRVIGYLTGQFTVKVIVVVVLIASVVTAGLQWHRADKADTREDERRQAGASAGRFGQALLSYDHTKLQAARDKVLSLASDDFAKTYDQAFTGGLEGIITKLKADASATVRTVYVGDIDGGNTRAVVVMDSEVHSTAGTRSVLGSYLDMKLTRDHGTWKVTEVTSVGAANESMTDPNGKQETTPIQPDPTLSPGG